MPSVADKVETGCMRCTGTLNVRTTTTQDGDVLNLCGRCRYSDAAQVDKAETLDDMRHTKMMGGYFRSAKGVDDPRKCTNCGNDVSDCTDLCETCLEAEIT